MIPVKIATTATKLQKIVPWAILGWKSARRGIQWLIASEAKKSLRSSLIEGAIQLTLILVSYAIVRYSDATLVSRLLASSVLWGITVYNVVTFFWKTVPNLRKTHRRLTGILGFIRRKIFRVSLIDGLLVANIVMLACCVVLVTAARWGLQTAFQYIEPWRQLFL